MRREWFPQRNNVTAKEKIKFQLILKCWNLILNLRKNIVNIILNIIIIINKIYNTILILFPV